MCSTIRLRVGLLAATVVLSAVSAGPMQPKLKVEDVIAGHLDSIAPVQVRSLLRSRTAQGTAHYELVIGGPDKADGQFTLASEGRNLAASLSIASNDYPGERFRSDGQKYDVGSLPTGVRSVLGTFIHAQGQILNEGLFCGVLSTSWPLLDVAARRPRLRYEGLKKVGGVMLHQVAYSPSKGASDLRIQLYFEPETFRHVRTTYRATMPAAMALTPSQSPQQMETNLILQEDFTDFRVFDGFTLPAHWALQYRIEGQKSLKLLWDVSLARVSTNVNIAPDVFRVP